MKRILFIAILISQVLICTEGVLFAQSEKNIAVCIKEKEAKAETIDEPEILENRREGIKLRAFFLPVSFYKNEAPIVNKASLPTQKNNNRRGSLFLIHSCIRI